MNQSVYSKCMYVYGRGMLIRQPIINYICVYINGNISVKMLKYISIIYFHCAYMYMCIYYIIWSCDNKKTRLKLECQHYTYICDDTSNHRLMYTYICTYKHVRIYTYNNSFICVGRVLFVFLFDVLHFNQNTKHILATKSFRP